MSFSWEILAFSRSVFILSRVSYSRWARLAIEWGKGVEESVLVFLGNLGGTVQSITNSSIKELRIRTPRKYHLFCGSFCIFIPSHIYDMSILLSSWRKLFLLFSIILLPLQLLFAGIPEFCEMGWTSKIVEWKCLSVKEIAESKKEKMLNYWFIWINLLIVVLVASIVLIIYLRWIWWLWALRSKMLASIAVILLVGIIIIGWLQNYIIELVINLLLTI